MKPGRSIWKAGWRLVVGVVLLVWIFHAIFVLEGRQWWRGQPPPAPGVSAVPWESLPFLERSRLAWSHGPVEFWNKIRVVSPSSLAASLAFMGLTILLGVVRWRMVLRVHGLPLSFWRAMEISLVAQFFNSFLLGSTGGDVLKAVYAARETRHQKTEAVVSVLVDRLLGLFAILLFAVLMMFPNLALLGAHRRLAFLSVIVAGMFLGCGAVLFLSLWGGLSRTLPQARRWLARLPKGAELEKALNACRPVGRKPGVLLQTLAVSMALNVCCVLQVLSLCRGLGLQIDARSVFVVVPIIICIAALPIAPSGLGVRENLYVWMLAVPGINVPAVDALSLSLLAYAGFLAWSVIGGIVYLARKERDHLAPDVLEKEAALQQDGPK